MGRCTCGDAFVAVTGAHAFDCPVVDTEDAPTVGSRIACDCFMCGASAPSEPAIMPNEGTLLWPAPPGWGSLLRPDKRMHGMMPSEPICGVCSRKVADAALGLDGRSAGAWRNDTSSSAAGAAPGLQTQDARVGTEPSC